MGRFFNAHLMHTNILNPIMAPEKRPFIVSPVKKQTNLESLRKQFNEENRAMPNVTVDSPNITYILTAREKRCLNLEKARKAKKRKQEINESPLNR